MPAVVKQHDNSKQKTVKKAEKEIEKAYEPKHDHEEEEEFGS